jgi:hypothetical protein
MNEAMEKEKKKREEEKKKKVCYVYSNFEK